MYWNPPSAIPPLDLSRADLPILLLTVAIPYFGTFHRRVVLGYYGHHNSWWSIDGSYIDREHVVAWAAAPEPWSAQ